MKFKISQKIKYYTVQSHTSGPGFRPPLFAPIAVSIVAHRL